MTRSPLGALVLTTSLLVTGAAAGTLAGQEAAARVRDPYRPVDTLVRVMAIIERSWVDEVSLQELVDAAITGMVASLDRHSAWLPASRWDALREQTQGSVVGFGLEVRLDEGGARVLTVVPDSPAARAGVLPGDLILEVEGHAITASDLDVATRTLLGPSTEDTTLRVLREGWSEPRVLTTRRERVQTPSVTAERIDGAILYVRLEQFRDGASDQIEAAIEDFSDGGGFRQMVLDLRDNPGGLLAEAVEVADLFLEDGLITRTEGRAIDPPEIWEATPGSWQGDLVILVNGLSASGSEIVAAALQDRDRATILGTRTYGKGSVQTVYEHRDGSALKLTIGRYLTPSGTPVADREGRLPDVLVPWPGDVDPRDQLRAELASLDVPADRRDALLALVDDLPNATERRTRTPIPWSRPARERASPEGEDPQLAAAVAWLRSEP